MLRIVFIVLTAYMSLLTGRLVTSDQPQTEDKFMKVRTEYADVLALQGTVKGETLAIARLLRANPKMAVDQTVIRGCLWRVQQTEANLVRGLDLQPNSTFCFKWLGDFSVPPYPAKYNPNPQGGLI